jgi:peroxiredoxin family protein
VGEWRYITHACLLASLKLSQSVPVSVFFRGDGLSYIPLSSSKTNFTAEFFNYLYVSGVPSNYVIDQSMINIFDMKQNIWT